MITEIEDKKKLIVAKTKAKISGLMFKKKSENKGGTIDHSFTTDTAFLNPSRN
jgi:hypothetical protein